MSLSNVYWGTLSAKAEIGYKFGFIGLKYLMIGNHSKTREVFSAASNGTVYNYDHDFKITALWTLSINFQFGSDEKVKK